MISEPITTLAQMLARKQLGKYENDVVHPATAKWLTDHGYAWEYEVLMPLKGRADFVAHKDDKDFIIECKVSCDNFDLSIAQAKGYQEQYNPDALIMIVVPQECVTQRAETLARFTDVSLVGVRLLDREIDPLNLSESRARARRKVRSFDRKAVFQGGARC